MTVLQYARVRDQMMAQSDREQSLHTESKDWPDRAEHTALLTVPISVQRQCAQRALHLRELMQLPTDSDTGRAVTEQEWVTSAWVQDKRPSYGLRVEFLAESDANF